jgi:hypothetical protein
MKASELRINNLVNYKIVDELDERKEWFEPCEIDAVDLQVIDSDYQPIPLTEEWLLKFGFEKSDNNFDWYIKDNYCVSFLKELDLIVFKIKFQTVDICKIKYVHQLQNLYFALTNEELTLTK